MAWKDLLEQGSEIVLTTASKGGIPNAIVVVSLGMTEGKLIIGACQMVSTLKNLEENDRVCVVAMDGKEYYRIRGKASRYASGRYHDLACERESDGYEIKVAIVIDIEDVFDLDKNEKLL